MIDTVVKPRQGNLDPKLKALLGDETHPKKGYIYCAACSHIISHIDQRIEVNGSHDHNFVNPHGYRFHVGCFAQALGCAISGRPQAADSWFPGFEWRIASCEECQSHLGWFFATADAQASSFYGLVTDRIQSE
ncbi:MAG: hypothetical protein HC809_07955 [Gammaproteobacteria bacterium]|nr:hypothetical protein [Gammaproteobacteria bacterium]